MKLFAVLTAVAFSDASAEPQGGDPLPVSGDPYPLPAGGGTNGPADPHAYDPYAKRSADYYSYDYDGHDDGYDYEDHDYDCNCDYDHHEDAGYHGAADYHDETSYNPYSQAIQAGAYIGAAFGSAVGAAINPSYGKRSAVAEPKAKADPILLYTISNIVAPLTYTHLAAPLAYTYAGAQPVKFAKAPTYAGLDHSSQVGVCLNNVGVQVPC